MEIKVVTIGHMPADFNKLKIKNWRSDVFSIVGAIESHSLTSNADGTNWEYTDNNLENQVPARNKEDILLAIVNVPIENNYYSRRLENNRIVITLYEIKEILGYHNLPLENLVLRLLYTYTLVFRSNEDSIPLHVEDEHFSHDETRGCLFDMCGNKIEIIHSCDNPKICLDCSQRLGHNNISNEVLSDVQKEIEYIKKPLVYRIVSYTNKHPFRWLVASSFSAIALGVMASYISAQLF